MASFEDARRMILAAVRPLPAAVVGLREALGRVAEECVIATEDAVPYPRSAMDGYAVHSAECAGATRVHPIELPVAGEIFAGGRELQLPPGSAIAITTGAPLPRDADAVIPFENVERIHAAVRIFAPVAAGASVFPAGEDIRRGDRLTTPGEPLNAARLALLAFSGTTKVRVFDRPRVSIVCTGEELIDPGMTPAPGQIRNSNAVALTALVAELGGVPRDQGTATDDSAALSAMLESARRDADLLITTGGASRGERDLVKGTLKRLGAEFLFEQVAMRPGKPCGFAQWDGMPVCVLPGNPSAAFVCFQQLVRPALARLAGRAETALPVVRARLQGSLHARRERRYFVLSRLEIAADGFAVTPLENQCSALVRTAADCNAIVVVRETCSEAARDLNPGDFVGAEVIEWPRAGALPMPSPD